MTVMRVMQRVADPSLEALRAIHSARPNPGRKVDTRPRDHYETVESKRSSTEIAFVMCEGFECTDEKEVGRKDACVETAVAELPGVSHSSLAQRKDPSAIPPNDFESPVVPNNSELPIVHNNLESRTNSDDHRQVVWETMARVEGSSKDRTERRESVDRKRNRSDRTTEKEKCNSRWKAGGQTILQFFAKILSKRGGMGAREATDRVSPASRRHGRQVERVSRSNKKQNGRGGRDADGGGGGGGGVRLKTVGNGYMANRANENRRGCTAAEEDRSREEEHRPSILVRQIRRTRDKNLRVMLLERELRARLPERDVAALTANGVVNFRQLSSPLC